MEYCVWIKNARVIDPAREIDRVEDILVLNTKIVPFSRELADKAEDVIDAEGCIAVPGLVDFHIHAAHYMGDLAVHPDVLALPNGITALVDQGSTGSANVEGLIRYVAASSEVTMRAFLNVNAVGVATHQYNESFDPALYDVDRIRYLFERYPDFLLGLKLRLGHTYSDGLGVKPLEAAKKIGAELGKPVCVHLVRLDQPYADYLSLLEKGDIVTHIYQADSPITILDDSGKVSKVVRDARERGVIFDSAIARTNHSLDVMRKAFADGFYPDIVSTDLVAASAYRNKLFSLPFAIAKHLAVGMPLPKAIEACTVAPARVMGLEGRIGTLAPGADADIAIFRIREKPMQVHDRHGAAADGDQLLVPQVTIKAGRLAYKQIDFEL